MFWTLIVVTLLPISERSLGAYSKYYAISQHESRMECEIALHSFTQKRIAVSKNEKAVCIKTDDFFKRLTVESSH